MTSTLLFSFTLAAVGSLLLGWRGSNLLRDAGFPEAAAGVWRLVPSALYAGISFLVCWVLPESSSGYLLFLTCGCLVLIPANIHAANASRHGALEIPDPVGLYFLGAVTLMTTGTVLGTTLLILQPTLDTSQALSLGDAARAAVMQASGMSACYLGMGGGIIAAYVGKVRRAESEA